MSGLQPLKGCAWSSKQNFSKTRDTAKSTYVLYIRYVRTFVVIMAALGDQRPVEIKVSWCKVSRKGLEPAEDRSMIQIDSKSQK